MYLKPRILVYFHLLPHGINTSFFRFRMSWYSWGHEKCGAVSAPLEANGEPEGNSGVIVKKIPPSGRSEQKAIKKPLNEMFFEDDRHRVIVLRGCLGRGSRATRGGRAADH
jgi:hypothetical protein